MSTQNKEGNMNLQTPKQVEMYLSEPARGIDKGIVKTTPAGGKSIMVFNQQTQKWVLFPAQIAKKLQRIEASNQEAA